MKDIPARLQCGYCERNFRHGGECQRPSIQGSEGGCLAFRLDPKGCIRQKDFILSFPLFYDIPLLKMWDDNWTINGMSTEMCIERIYGIKWDTKKGQLILYCECKYYINEFRDNYVEPKEKPKLRRVK